jgi:hypothetical protein
MIVGGYALAFHGKPRHTGDLDIWIAISDVNAEKMTNVIRDFGMASLKLQMKDFYKPDLLHKLAIHHSNRHTQ